MPSQNEKARRRAIAHALREADEAAAQARRPLDKAVLRELLPFLERELLVGGQDGNVLTRCDHTLTKTRRFLEQRNAWSNSLPDWFAEYGGFCDCEVMYNVFDYWDAKRLNDQEPERRDA